MHERPAPEVDWVEPPLQSYEDRLRETRAQQAIGILTAFQLFQSIPSVFYIKLLDLRSRPGGPSQELQAGLDARVIIKASDIDDLPQFFPPMMLYELGKHHFQRDTMKGIFMLLGIHSYIIFH